jgi:hypothetical protein
MHIAEEVGQADLGLRAGQELLVGLRAIGGVGPDVAGGVVRSINSGSSAPS